MKPFFEKIGLYTEESVNNIGLMCSMFLKSILHLFTPPLKIRSCFKQMEFVGVDSLFIVILTGLFTGMVLALQGYLGLSRFGATSMVGPTVALSMTRELGPVLAALMVTGRAGSAMATELGTMRVTEQIDALFTMGLNPIKHLVVPRILAGLLMMPFLTIVADFVGMLGAYVISVKYLGINSGVYIGRTIDYLTITDVIDGLVKSVFFGLIITLSACFYGYYTKGGAEGVGKSATRAVVLSCVMILISDYIITSIMM